MGSKGNLTADEVHTIIDLINKGWKNKDIIKATGRSQYTIRQIRYNQTDWLERAAVKQSYDVEKWLYEHWHFKKPQKTVKRKTDFRTPYNCRGPAWR